MTKIGPTTSKLDRTAIGVVGLPGSGKSVVAALLAEQLEAEIVVMGDVIREEAKRRGIPARPTDMRTLMITLRKEYGADVVALKCLQKIAELGTPSKVVIIDGLRSLPELEAFRRGLQSFHLVAIYASPQIRFSRLKQRDRSDDPSAWAIFEARDSLEAKVGVSDLFAQADYSITNEQDLETLEHRVRELVEWFKKN